MKICGFSDCTNIDNSRQPLRAVFRDSSFTEAAAKMNLFELFKQKCGWSESEVKNNVRVI